MDDVAAGRRVIATSSSESRPEERATRPRGVGGGERGRKSTRVGSTSTTGASRKVSLTLTADDQHSVHDLRLGRKGSKVSTAEGGGGAGGGGGGGGAWARNHAQVKIIAATRVRKGSTSFKDLILRQDDAGAAAAFSAGGAMLAPNANAKKKSGGGGGAQRGRSPKNTLSANNSGNRKRSSSTRRTGASSPRPERRGSFQDESKKEGKEKEEEESARRSSQQLRLDTLAQLAMKVKALGDREGKLSTSSDDGVPQLSEDDQKKLASICNVFAGGKMLGKKTFKEFAKEEILREPSEIDKMIAGSKVIAAFGRRNFDEEEICPDAGDADDEEETFFADDNEELKFKVRAAKARYLAMFEKKESKEEKDKKKLTEMAPDPKAYGLWDSVSSIKALPTLMRAKREWVPPDWDKIVQQLKAEGRDVASIDADLKDICHGSGAEDVALKKTGKYLMPDDMLWCRKHARFREKDLLKWFRRFREKCPKGTMNKAVFGELFKSAFPMADTEVITDIVFEVFDSENKEKLDFKVCLGYTKCFVMLI